MANVTIGQTTALIPEAGQLSSPRGLNDGQSGNTKFPYSSFKALATVGEVDAETEVGLTCYPDGSLTHATYVEKGVSKTVANDGLYWAKGRGGNVLILDEDSGNDYGERR